MGLQLGYGGGVGQLVAGEGRLGFGAFLLHLLLGFLQLLALVGQLLP